MPRRSRVHA